MLVESHNIQLSLPCAQEPSIGDLKIALVAGPPLPTENCSEKVVVSPPRPQGCCAGCGADGRQTHHVVPGSLGEGVRLARVLAGGTTAVLPRPRMSTLGPSRRVRHRSLAALAERLCVGSFIARNSFTAACIKFQILAGLQTSMGSLWPPRRGAVFFCRMQGRARAPGRYGFHLRFGQPLASESRSTLSWVPFLGLMRLGTLAMYRAHAWPRARTSI